MYPHGTPNLCVCVPKVCSHISVIENGVPIAVIIGNPDDQTFKESRILLQYEEPLEIEKTPKR